MKSETFYRNEDLPSDTARERMWRAVSRSTGHSRAFVIIRDTRSFFSGMAAAVILLLSGTGVYSLVSGFLESREPREIRFDDAYQSAIREFESVLPSKATIASTEPAADVIQSKFSQLKLIDAAISELRSDIARTDLSPLKRSRLYRLYSMKLGVLQEIIEQGGIEL